MNKWNPRQILIDLFLHLRSCGFSLGLRELLAAERAVAEGWGADGPSGLQPVVRLLWCSSLEEIGKFEVEWTNLVEVPAIEWPTPANVDESFRSTGSRPTPEDVLDETPLPDASSSVEPTTTGFGTLPVQAPFIPATINEMPDLHSYWPLSRQDMAYAWRYLRRPVADGPANVLDLPATVEQTVHRGFFLAPVYRRRIQNHAHLTLLLDQNGSMVPFHRFARDLISTAQESKAIHHVDVFYFHNTPTDHLYQDQHLTRPVSLAEALEDCDQNSSLLIVSDAGAARGYRSRERIQATTRFLRKVRAYTPLVAWLNPMPMERWPGSSAQIIAHRIPMFQMDADGVASAVDIARGQLAPHTH